MENIRQLNFNLFFKVTQFLKTLTRFICFLKDEKIKDKIQCVIFTLCFSVTEYVWVITESASAKWYLDIYDILCGLVIHTLHLSAVRQHC